ncbi:MAG: hypothetical protein WBB24_17410 [Maribacter sp.]
MPTKKNYFIIILLFLCFIPSFAEAQCAMCRAVLESESSGNTAEGINNGIIYLMALPYILVAGLFYFIYRKMRA